MPNSYYGDKFKVGNQYLEFVEDPNFGGRQTLKVLTPQDIQGRQIDVSQIQTIDPSQLQVVQNDSLSAKLGKPVYVIADTPATHELAGRIIPNAETAQSLGINPGATPSGGGVQTSDVFSKYLSSTGQTYSNGQFSGGTVGGPTSTQGSGGQPGISTSVDPNTLSKSGQYVKVGNDVYDASTGQRITLDQFKSLGLNFNLLPSATTPPTAGSYNPANTGSTWADQNAKDSLKFLFGWDDNQVNNFIATDKDAQQWALTAEYMKKQYDLKGSVDQANAASLQKAHEQALRELSDPNSMLGQKYADLDKTSAANFQQNLALNQTGLDEQTRQQAQAFQEQRQNQADQFAQAGAVYSGFANRAKQNLASDQSGIIESTRSQLKKSLTSLAQPLEAYYGSQKFNQLFGGQGLRYNNPLTGQSEQIAYNPLGLTGTEANAKESDALQRQQEIYNNLKV